MNSLSAYNTPFNYDLHQTTIPGENQETTIVFHGMTGDYHNAEFIKIYAKVNDTLITFNFPDYNFPARFNDLSKLTFGSIQEILPALYVIQTTLQQKHLDKVNLYGFSAGGGALINMLNVLHSTDYDLELKKIGIDAKAKNNMLSALAKGIVILDCPLKSVGEIISIRGRSPELDVIKTKYDSKGWEPIESLKSLHHLGLNIIVYFENPDEVLGNKDDVLFVERLKQANDNGKTVYLTGKSGGHTSVHPKLWNYYHTLINKTVPENNKTSKISSI